MQKMGPPCSKAVKKISPPYYTSVKTIGPPYYTSVKTFLHLAPIFGDNGKYCTVQCTDKIR